MILLNLENTSLSGQMLQDELAQINITSNKNPIPLDSPRPSEWKGVRLGVAAATTRGMIEQDFEQIGTLISTLINSNGSMPTEQREMSLRCVKDLCNRYPIYAS